MTNLHAENVAVEVDGLAAVAHLEHPVQGAAAQLQRHLLMFILSCHLEAQQEVYVVPLINSDHVSDTLNTVYDFERVIDLFVSQ